MQVKPDCTWYSCLPGYELLNSQLSFAVGIVKSRKHGNGQLCFGYSSILGRIEVLKSPLSSNMYEEKNAYVLFVKLAFCTLNIYIGIPNYYSATVYPVCWNERTFQNSDIQQTTTHTASQRIWNRKTRLHCKTLRWRLRVYTVHLLFIISQLFLKSHISLENS